MKLSMIIPALNEAEYIFATIEKAKENAFFEDAVNNLTPDKSNYKKPEIFNLYGSILDKLQLK